MNTKFYNKLQALINDHGIDSPSYASPGFLRDVFMLCEGEGMWLFDEGIDMTKFVDGPLITHFLIDAGTPEADQNLGRALVEYIRKDLIRELNCCWLDSPNYDNDSGEVGPAKYQRHAA